VALYVVWELFLALIFLWKETLGLLVFIDTNVLVRLKRGLERICMQGEKNLNERIKVFGLVALLGFFAGVIADLTSEYVIPKLMEVLPLLNARFILSGLAGSVLTLVLVSVWAYIQGPKEP